jgi:hypothetical protein
MSVLAAVLALAYTSMVPLTIFCLTMAVPLGLGTGAVFKLVPKWVPDRVGRPERARSAARRRSSPASTPGRSLRNPRRTRRAVGYVDDRPDRRRDLEPRRLAGLTDVPPREGALRHHPVSARSPSTIGTTSSLPRHRQPDLAYRLVVARDREVGPHDVAHAQEDVREELRHRGPGAREYPRRLGVVLAEPDRDVFVGAVRAALELRVVDWPTRPSPCQGTCGR